MKISVETSKRFEQLIPSLQRDVLKAGAQAAFDYAKAQADEHTVTGALARSAQIRPITQGYEIYHDRQMAPHALFVHWGTRPHDIVPNRRKALRWVEGNQFVFAKLVHHPGYKGDPWMIRARKVAADTIVEIVRKTANAPLR